jgi:hypothetical protein
LPQAKAISKIREKNMALEILMECFFVKIRNAFHLWRCQGLFSRSDAA